LRHVRGRLLLAAPAYFWLMGAGAPVRPCLDQPPQKWRADGAKLNVQRTRQAESEAQAAIWFFCGISMIHCDRL